MSRKWIQLIFLIGLPHSEDKEVRHRIEEEKLKHKDLVQVNVLDAYLNLTLKSVALLHWANTRCPDVDLVLKCDDDIYLNIEALTDLISEEEFKPTDRLFGLGVTKDQPQRNPGSLYTIYS